MGRVSDGSADVCRRVVGVSVVLPWVLGVALAVVVLTGGFVSSTASVVAIVSFVACVLVSSAPLFVGFVCLVGII